MTRGYRIKGLNRLFIFNVEKHISSFKLFVHTRRPLLKLRLRSWMHLPACTVVPRVSACVEESLSISHHSGCLIEYQQKNRLLIIIVCIPIVIVYNLHWQLFAFPFKTISLITLPHPRPKDRDRQ